MKKLLLAVAVVVAAGSLKFAVADGPAIPASVSDQFLASLTKDMAAVIAHTSKGDNKAEFLTSLVQVGNYRGEYILGLDLGVVGGTDSIRKTYGAHLHLTPFVLSNVAINPDLAAFLSHVELTPRYSFDEDAGHGVLSYTFGARIGFGGK